MSADLEDETALAVVSAMTEKAVEGTVERAGEDEGDDEAVEDSQQHGALLGPAVLLLPGKPGSGDTVQSCPAAT